MKSVQLIQSIPRYLLSKAIGPMFSSIYWSPLAVLQYRDIPEPGLPGPEWVRIQTHYGGICGSDMNAVRLNDSLALTTMVSFPFTLGHENVGTIVETGSEVRNYSTGDRVVVEPLLPCVTRGIHPPCSYCSRGEYALCENFAEGQLSPGLSIGHCRDTGGSWSPYFVAHQSQLFHLPDSVNNENGLMLDAFCTTLHPVLRNYPADGETVLVLGAGVVGLCTVTALRQMGSKARVVVAARYPFQGNMAYRCGADEVIYPDQGDLLNVFASGNDDRVYQPVLGKPVLVGGADIVFECVGTASSIDSSLRLTRGGGKVILVGLASNPKGIDWTPIWLNELSIKGSFWCCTETYQDRRIRTYQIALEWMESGKLDLSHMITHRFRLDDYRHALKITSQRGKHQLIKSVFTFQDGKG